jgi:hypothetical protein
VVAIEFLGSHHDNGFPMLLDHSLRTLSTHPAEQLAEPRLRIVKLPDRLFGHSIDYFD